MSRAVRWPRLASVPVLLALQVARAQQATCPLDGACTGCAADQPPLGVYEYSLPPHGQGQGTPESFYEGGYEQYATELVLPNILRASKHYEPNPERASLFLVPYQGVSAPVHARQSS